MFETKCLPQPLTIVRHKKHQLERFCIPPMGTIPCQVLNYIKRPLRRFVTSHVPILTGLVSPASFPACLSIRAPWRGRFAVSRPLSHWLPV